MKVLHLFTIEKFVDGHIYNIQNAGFDNTYIFLNKQNEYKGSNKDVKHIVPYSSEFNDLIKKASEFDFIMVYFLKAYSAYLINRLAPSSTKIIWSFYGADLYEMPQLRYKIFSSKTKGVLKIHPFEPHKRKLKEYIKRLIYLTSSKKTDYTEIENALKRIDYFCWFSLEEYDYLNKIFNKKLPPFLQSSNRSKSNNITIAEKKDTKILLGNSANPANNHVDMIDLLKEKNFLGEITIPFNYGSNRNYNQKLKNARKDIGLKITYLESFMKPADYTEFLNSQSTLIFNSYRQMGLGNIFIAMECGLKVYLSNKNPSYLWLKNLGFDIYSIEDQLPADITSDNLKLGYNQALSNSKLLINLFSEENEQAFLQKIKSL